MLQSSKESKNKALGCTRRGTRNQRAATYWENNELEKHHAYLIFTSGRFTENHEASADKVRPVDKKYFFVRAKIDEDLRNAMYDQGLESYTDEQEHEKQLKIRKDCLEHLKDVDSNLVDVLLD